MIVVLLGLAPPTDDVHCGSVGWRLLALVSLRCRHRSTGVSPSFHWGVAIVPLGCRHRSTGMSPSFHWGVAIVPLGCRHRSTGVSLWCLSIHLDRRTDSNKHFISSRHVLHSPDVSGAYVISLVKPDTGIMYYCILLL